MDRFKAALTVLATAAVITSILAGFALFAPPPPSSSTATYSTSTQVSSASSTPSSGSQQNQPGVSTSSSSASSATSQSTEASSSTMSSTSSSQAATATVTSVATAVASTVSSVTEAASTVTIAGTTTMTSTATSAQTTVTVAGTTATVAGSTTQASSPPQATSIVTSTVLSSVSSAAVARGSASGGFFGLLGVSRGESLLDEVKTASILLAPVCWILLGGAWVWRGRVRARYSELGFGSDVFELFMKMKGGATRVKVLNTLTTPKDRLQLADELGVDWKTVDRHVQILNKYGFVREQSAYGTVRLYELTPLGKMLLNLFDDLSKTNGPISRSAPDESGESRPAN